VGLAPKTEFVLRADSHLAYQVFGTGNAKVLMLYGVPSHLDYFWEFPIRVRVHERLARLARVAVYDWRGYGMSDPLPTGGYPIEELAADALGVLDAAHFERTVLWGDFAGGAAVWLAVHCPERVDGLVLVDSFARLRADAGYDIGFSEAEVAERRALFQAVWGTGASIELVAPSLAADEHLREQWAAIRTCSPVPQPTSRTRPRRRPSAARVANAGCGAPMSHGGVASYAASNSATRSLAGCSSVTADRYSRSPHRVKAHTECPFWSGLALMVASVDRDPEF
jgi:pimeloyl-ACP methyl ester carboxylesterase